MPIYEYSCNKCLSRFELLRRLSDTAEVKCNKCGSDEVEKVISRFSCGGNNLGASDCAPSSFS